jgi:tRNA pseudouridine55 synthase
LNPTPDGCGTQSVPASGIILLDKEPGCTSFQALSGLKRKLGTRHIGHAGTLDKFAEGLLVVLVGPCTRLAPLLQGLDKEYVARIRFGIETDTLDPEGEPVAEAPVPELETIQSAFPKLTGEILQVPPAYSAVHVKGARASKLARKGLTPELTARTVRINRIDLLGYDPPDLMIRVSCSKGTYIRSLARDLALLCGSRA